MSPGSSDMLQPLQSSGSSDAALIGATPDLETPDASESALRRKAEPARSALCGRGALSHDSDGTRFTLDLDALD